MLLTMLLTVLLFVIVLLVSSHDASILFFVTFTFIPLVHTSICHFTMYRLSLSLTALFIIANHMIKTVAQFH